LGGYGKKAFHKPPQALARKRQAVKKPSSVFKTFQLLPSESFIEAI
jgi:hypothetical protein